VSVYGEDVEITNIKVSNHAEKNGAVCVVKGSSVEGCDLRGSVVVEEGGTLLLKDSRVHHAAEPGVIVHGIADLQDCIAEGGLKQGIVVRPTGKATISGTKVRRNGTNGVVVKGEATIKGSGVTANARAASWPGRWTAARASAPSATTSSAAATTRTTVR